MSRVPAFWRIGAMALALAVLTVAAVAWAYQNRAPWTLDVGAPGDVQFLSGFHADEADTGYRYRWSTDHATMILRDIGAVNVPLALTLRVQGYRPPPEPPPVITVTVNGAWRTIVPLTTTMASYTLGPVTGYPPADSLVVTLDSPTFTPPGDARALGVKVDGLSVAPRAAVPLPAPPMGVLLAAVVAVLGTFAVLWRLLAGWRGRAQAIGATAGTVLGVLALEGGFVWAGLLTTWALQTAAPLLALAGLVAGGWPWLRRWPALVDRLADRKSYVAPGLLALALLAYALFVLPLLPQIPWIGHADYADNAVVARNLAAGRGYVVDYVTQFYKEYPGITHPAETWPILQPTLIAPFFALFGPQEWAARLPNLLLLLALAVAVYVFGARWWDRRVGLLAALFTLCHPYFFQSVLYPINDLVFTLLALLTIGLTWEAVRAGEARPALGGERQESAVRNQQADELSPQSSVLSPPSDAVLEAQFTGLDMRLATARAQQARAVRRTWLAAGVAAGLLVWSKPTGLLLIGGLLAALWLRGRLTRWAGRPRLRNAERALQNDTADNAETPPARRASQWTWLWFVAPFGLVLLPLLARNLVTFGTPFYSTEGLDAWILRYWMGDPQTWERIYAVYTGPGREAPHPRLLLGGSFDVLFAAIGKGFTDVWEAAFWKGEVLPLPLALGGVAGWLLAPRRGYGLLGAALGAFGAMALFVLIYWHYEARYFLGLVPWLYLGLAGGLFWVWDQARARRPADAVPFAPGRWAQALLPLAAALVLGPSLTNIGEQARDAQLPDQFAEAGRWLAAHSAADAVVMSRDPWELNWYSARRVVMIPWGAEADVRAIARQYGVDYLWVGGPSWRFRRAQIEPLLPTLDVTEVYRSADGSIRIYQWNP